MCNGSANSRGICVCINSSADDKCDKQCNRQFWSKCDYFGAEFDESCINDVSSDNDEC
jgi:hypothetical protein